jgi:hypothetical protein
MLAGVRVTHCNPSSAAPAGHPVTSLLVHCETFWVELI